MRACASSALQARHVRPQRLECSPSAEPAALPRQPAASAWRPNRALLGPCGVPACAPISPRHTPTTPQHRDEQGVLRRERVRRPVGQKASCGRLPQRRAEHLSMHDSLHSTADGCLHLDERYMHCAVLQRRMWSVCMQP